MKQDETPFEVSLTVPQLARDLHIPERDLQAMMTAGVGPPFVRLPTGQVRFLTTQVSAWLLAQQRQKDDPQEARARRLQTVRIPAGTGNIIPFRGVRLRRRLIDKKEPK